MLPENKGCHAPCYWDVHGYQQTRERSDRALDGLWPTAQGTRESQEKVRSKQNKASPVVMLLLHSSVTVT